MTTTSPTTDPVVLRALCDTIVPRVPAPPGSSPAARELWELSATGTDVPEVLASALTGLAAHVRAAVDGALSAWWTGAAEEPPEATDRWNRVSADPATAFGARVITGTVCGAFYTLPDRHGRNPTWPALEFDGPLLDPPTIDQRPRTLRRLPVPADGTHLAFDVVVVGSGAGGGVAAARLAAAGRTVLVLERGGYRNEADLPQQEALAFPNLYLEGGYIWSSNGSLGLLAGSTVGGGTMVNSMACLPPPEHVLAEWTDRGLQCVHPDELAPHLWSVQTRINASTANSRHNVNNRLLTEAFDRLGVAHDVLPRNARNADDQYCGACNSGCAVGCKQSTMLTFLQDASEDGALLLADCRADQVLVVEGRATGVAATVQAPDGGVREIVVRADTVVLAAGALSTPLLLQASGIGGPRVGEGLHVHPAYFMSGVFDEPVRAWRGQILSTYSTAFDRVESGHGFLVEAAPITLGAWTSLTPWRSGQRHKADQLRLPYVAGVWGSVRDHGAGRVVADAAGRPVVHWELTDDVDLAVTRRCHQELARLLRAAGAREIVTFLPGDPRWREGEDFADFLAVLGRLTGDEVFTLSAHQSGTCAAGADPATSVVDGRGELHGVRGVWVADASAFPTAPGVNPMVTIEAWASRTAALILASG